MAADISKNSTPAGSIVARVVDETAGLKVIYDVKAVRIHSSNYVLLIMDDYSPTLGEVDGDVTFLAGDDEIAYRGIKGCYKQQNNIFTMIIEEKKQEEKTQEDN